MTIVLGLMVNVPLFFGLLLVGVPLKASLGLTSLSVALGGYYAFRVIRDPDDPGSFVRFIQTVTGQR